MAPAAAASKSFVLSAMLRLCNLLSYQIACLLALRRAEALQTAAALCLLGAIPLRLCAFYKSTLAPISCCTPQLRRVQSLSPR